MAELSLSRNSRFPKKNVHPRRPSVSLTLLKPFRPRASYITANMGPGPKYRGRPGTQRPGRGGHGKRGSAKYLGKRQRFDSARVAQKEE